ncbi:hypothetical protein [Tessaracoccus antarcticus]|uniref:PPi-type phosphoenolpyruvate carboxykinase lobe 2 domain-containing protein n=1 Tax=Tessaracoccus antarcticus TaxID=2479848 RepID=A0A3M0FZ51_9ACTN|nr:hypothetical protein [Tessaracoccus antarcticus]RMB57775.1 hypothetical protein EAX62_15030 [Tessaracoccus antarcticus]
MAKYAENAAINLRLGMLGLPMPEHSRHSAGQELVQPILARQRELNRRLAHRLPAVDSRIQSFLDSYLEGTGTSPQLPKQTFVLDQPGLARSLSLPMDGDQFASEHLTSYRLVNGVLHNPTNDRRTTKGVFHIAEGGLPIQDDKIAVPREVFGRIMEAAFQPPTDAMVLPYGADEVEPPKCWASLQLRPIVVPAVPGFSRERTLEIRFFAPGTLMANLDFVEGIFGNAGDPYLPQNDASLDPESWTGHTGAVVLAPHLTKLNKKELGLPHVDDATKRQRRDGMCWESEDELYNHGTAFKLCARDERGVIVTVIADNYFGYCKKEVKAQISYSANLTGLVEEEHSGGAIVFPRYNLGGHFSHNCDPAYSLADVVARDPQRFVPQHQGHALDRENRHVVLVPAGTTYSISDGSVSWEVAGVKGHIQLRAETSYMGPDGYMVDLHHVDTDGSQWTLVGTSPDATACHKPATVSGGGKSEISKAITDAIISGNAYVADIDADIAAVQAILDRDYTGRFVDPAREPSQFRPILSERRSIGSVIKLMSPNSDYTPEYNEWLESIPHHIKELLYVVKRFNRPEWGDDWPSHFSTGIVNGRKGTSLRVDGEKVHVNMLRVGFEPDGSWRLFGLRHDFHPAAKVQTEDDITASIIAPPRVTGMDVSRKFVTNCERLLFQRPDDAIHRGYDKQAEADIASGGTFLSNFQPLTRDDAKKLVEDAIAFSKFSPPIQGLIRRSAAGGEALPKYFVSSAHPRLVNGKPSKNPRYLQVRPDLADPQATAIADLATHLFRKQPTDTLSAHSVDVVAAGRRNNAAEPGVPPLCSYSPLHWMDLPELLMEFISSMTGKSPSTTGAGSEGAMTKGPFNPLPSIIDLNAAFLSFALTEYDGWLSSAGVIGPKVRVDHDISLLVPEVFSRMTPAERDAASLIKEGCLEPLEDFDHDGETVLASRLGYRMTSKFTSKYFGRIFLHPHVVFTEQMLRPEQQDMDTFAEAIRTIVTTHQRVAQTYIDDGTIALAVPPVRALLEVMATGATAEGLTLKDPEFRETFTRRSVVDSSWYTARLVSQRDTDIAHAEHALAAMADFTSKELHRDTSERLGIIAKTSAVSAHLAELRADTDANTYVGTLGRQVTWRI